MALQRKNSKDLLSPEKLRLKILVYGLSGLGKTSFAATAPDPGYLACETGQGNGLLTVAEKGIDYATPENLADIEEFAKGKVFAEKQSLVIDSLSEVVKRYVKAEALKIPRKNGDTDKRRRGIPELDDYGTMGELTRRLLAMLFDCNPDKHIIVTATEKYNRVDENDAPGTESLVGPDLPGAMFLGSPAMFDLVLRVRSRMKLRNPQDAKSRYAERYFITNPDGTGSIVKCRAVGSGKPLLDKEEVFDLETGRGTFPDLLNKVLTGYGFTLKKAA